MTVTKLSDEERTAEAILAKAEAHCAEMLDDLEAVRLYYKDKTDLPEAELKRVLANVQKSVQTVFDERRRLDEFRKRQLGIVNEYALDFDAVRSEVGGRLDRIRAARDAGQIPQ
ncbi:hypothetical protein LX81_01446 [Palleronia aestuarii]|uniref:Uncharacterized protein n=1 Tax=Palleronia aestuarii TaxID=568105 RepID=A0A2W7Q7G1_9RHOB|nr:hypothetical protein [Palleronia aestuarii]PZX17719.1 hypothetical protein LX81_01446 [Palleronia aestuarii]